MKESYTGRYLKDLLGRVLIGGVSGRRRSSTSSRRRPGPWCVADISLDEHCRASQATCVRNDVLLMFSHSLPRHPDEHHGCGS